MRNSFPPKEPAREKELKFSEWEGKHFNQKNVPSEKLKTIAKESKLN